MAHEAKIHEVQTIILRELLFLPSARFSDLRQKTDLDSDHFKHPFFGFYGYPGGKIRWGETILQAAARELDEETGLAATMTYRGVYHEHIASKETGEILEDKIFHIVSATSPTKKLIEQFEGGRNSWMTVENLQSLDKKYLSTDIETNIGLGKESFVEKVQVYTKEDF